MSVLVLDKVNYQYSGTTNQVLKNVTAKFDTGNLYVIMGKSGSGKSTLLSLISGLDIPTQGVVYYQGKDMKQLDRDQYRARSIGVIFQGYNLLTNATALENIVLSMNISGCKGSHLKQTALEILQRVGIDEETAKRKVLKLSGGEQQRVGIARAISHDPDIIIADEPTGNLDEDTQNMIMKILYSLAHDEGKCVIVVTHSKAVAGYADELWGLNRGHLVFVK